jgi:hypothetical protein
MEYEIIRKNKRKKLYDISDLETGDALLETPLGDLLFTGDRRQGISVFGAAVGSTRGKVRIIELDVEAISDMQRKIPGCDAETLFSKPRVTSDREHSTSGPGNRGYSQLYDAMRGVGIL